jgi:hypothetical protein
MRGKRTSGQFDIRRGDSSVSRGIAPTVDCGCDLFNDLHGPLRREPIKSGGSQNRLQAWTIVHIVDIQHMVCLVDVRIDIERWRKPPPVRAGTGPVRDS